VRREHACHGRLPIPGLLGVLLRHRG
jgi:hypothetical protein